MKVYIVYSGEYDDKEIFGIYSTLEKAKQVIDTEHEKERNGTRASNYNWWMANKHKHGSTYFSFWVWNEPEEIEVQE